MMTMKKLLKEFLGTKTNTACQLLFTATLSSTALLIPALANAAADTTIPVDLAGANATKHEIAVLQVLSEVCPPMLNSQQKAGFRKSYNAQLKQMLPTIDNPKAAIQYLSTQQDYKVILTSMRNWTMGFSHDENLALCNDLANAQP